MTKWTFLIEGLGIERSFTCPTCNQARMFVWQLLTEEQQAKATRFVLIGEEEIA